MGGEIFLRTVSSRSVKSDLLSTLFTKKTTQHISHNTHITNTMENNNNNCDEVMGSDINDPIKRCTSSAMLTSSMTRHSMQSIARD